MSVQINRYPLRWKADLYHHGRGMSRYNVSFSDGATESFVIKTPPSPQTHKWQAEFSVELAKVLLILADFHKRKSNPWAG
jgi:hypothetical protein